MKEETKSITHGRLMTRFAQIGPYLRQNKCEENAYFFDCLAVCVNAKKSPENREFWGWWFLLTNTESGFEYTYGFGMYDLKGEWTNDDVPDKATDEVKQSLDDFYGKLKLLCDELSLQISLQSTSKADKLGSS